MEPSFTDLGHVSVARIHQNTTGRGMLRYVELKRQGTTILRAFIKHTWMRGLPSKQISQSIDELLITFCGPIPSWKLPKDLNLMILELAGVAQIGRRSLRFTIYNSPHTEKFFMWNSKCQKKNVSASARRVESENPANGIST